MADIFPKIKKKVNAFLVGEEGKISKQSLMRTGAFLGAMATTSAIFSTTSASAAVTHVNTLSGSFNAGTYTLTGIHTHHGSHGSHASHGSHGSHSSSF